MTTFSGNQFLIKKKFLKILGSDFMVYDSSGKQIMFAHLKAFKLKEDITLYSDESKSDPIITIKARNIIDFSAAYDFFDAKSGTKVGAAKRQGWKSILRDEWILMDASDREVGKVREDSGLMAFLRRFVTNLIPQTFHVTVNNELVGSYKNNFNPIISKVTLTIEKNTVEFNPVFAIGMGILLCAIERKQR